MSLTKDDLDQIRGILRDEVREVVRNEVREIIRTEVREFFRGEGREIIRGEVSQEVSTAVMPQFHAVNEKLSNIDERLTRVEGEVEALGNDVREIYGMLKPLNSELNARLDDHEERIGALETA